MPEQIGTLLGEAIKRLAEKQNLSEDEVRAKLRGKATERQPICDGSGYTLPDNRHYFTCHVCDWEGVTTGEGKIPRHQMIPQDKHEIWTIEGDRSIGYYTEGKSRTRGWFCFEAQELGELVEYLHDLDFTDGAINPWLKQFDQAGNRIK